MTYTHLTPNELVMIEAYFYQETPVAIVAKQFKRGRQAIYNVYNYLKRGGTALEYYAMTGLAGADATLFGINEIFDFFLKRPARFTMFPFFALIKHLFGRESHPKKQPDQMCIFFLAFHQNFNGLELKPSWHMI